jgi:hypothetical protein
MRYVQIALVEPFRTLLESVNDLLDLPLVGLVEHGCDDLLYPHRHLPPLALLLLGGPVAPGGRGVVPVPAGSVPEDVPDSINTLFSEYLYKAEDALALNLFEDFEM